MSGRVCRWCERGVNVVVTTDISDAVNQEFTQRHVVVKNQQQTRCIRLT